MKDRRWPHARAGLERGRAVGLYSCGVNPDERLFLWMNGALDGPIATTFFGVVTWLGNGIVLAIAILVPLFVLDRRRFREHALALVLSVAASGILVTATKPVVDRARPPGHFAEQGVAVHAPGAVPRDMSFPSGHTQTAFGAGVYLSCMYPPAAPVFLAVATLVGISRIALGVHFPLDVAVGALVGAAFSVGGFLLNRRRLGRRQGGGAEPGAGGEGDASRG